MTSFNVFSVDVEDWYHGNGLAIPSSRWRDCQDRIADNIRLILDLLKQRQIKAVFFILGDVAQRHPELIGAIAAAGHEIGSHGYSHRLLGAITRPEFETDFQKARQVIEGITGRPVRYFRAPSWSISRRNLWVLEYLADQGICCDSSLQPFETPLSGIAGIPATPFHPVLGNRKLPLLEFPPTVYKFVNLTLPFCGGFYFRFWPYPVSRWLFNRLDGSRECMFYVHPWEIDPGLPKVNGSLAARFVHYYHLKTTLPKLNRLVRDFSFTTLEDVLASKDYPSFPLDSGKFHQASRLDA